MTREDLMWAPETCALPTAQRPLRVAEFGDLFATALRGQVAVLDALAAWAAGVAA